MSQITDRRVWIAMLAKLVAPANSPEAAKALAAMLPFLGDYPEAAFNLQSLEHVARTTRRLPSFAELTEALSGWWRENRPRPLAISYEATREGWQDQHARERAEAKADWSDPAKVTSSMRLVLSSEVKQLDLGRMLAALVRLHAPHNVGLLPPKWLKGLRGFDECEAPP